MGTAIAIRGFGNIEKMKSLGRKMTQQAYFGGGTEDMKPILQLDKDEGYWRFGSDGDELTEKDVIAVNPASFRHGYVAFGKEGTGVALTLDGDSAEVMVPFDFDPPIRDELPELELVRFKRGEPEREPDWKFCRSVDMVVVEGPNKGAEFVYKPTSRGGGRMVAKLQAEIGRRMEDGTEECVPLIELFSESYKHRTYGKIYNPTFEIIEWVTPDEDGTGEDDDTKPQKHPKKGERTAKGDLVDQREDEPEDDGEDEEDAKPARKGRRAAKEDAKPARKGRRSRAVEPEDDGPEEDEPEEDEPEETTRRRGSRRADVKERTKADTARRSRRGREEEPEEDDEPEEDAKPARRGRGRRDDRDKAVEARQERRGRRGRDTEDEDDGEEEAPRVRRRNRDTEDEDEGKRGPRGRNASGGRRSRR